MTTLRTMRLVALHYRRAGVIAALYSVKLRQWRLGIADTADGVARDGDR